MRRRVHIRPPRWIFWFILLVGTAMSIYIPFFLSRFGPSWRPQWLLFVLPPIVVAIVGLIGVLRGALPGMYYDIEIEDRPENGDGG